jgi:hypothetical protein
MVTEGLDQNADSRLEEWNVCFFGLLDDGGQRGNSVLLDERNSILDQVEELGADVLNASCIDGGLVVLHEVGEGSASVGHDTWALVIDTLDQAWDDLCGVLFLELFGHVVADLADGVEGSVLDFDVGVVAVLHNHWNHWLNLAWLVNVLTNLREGHKTSVLEAPILVVRDSVHNKLADQWQHNTIADGGNHTVDTRLSESDVVIILITLLGEALLGRFPLLWNLFVDVNHQLEDLLQDVLENLLVLLDKCWLALN